MTQGKNSTDGEAVHDPELRDEAQRWVARLVGGDIGAAELDDLEAWLAQDPRHALAFSRERALWQDLHALADVLEDTSSGATPMPGNVVSLRATVSSRRRLTRFAPLAVAASLAAIVMAPSLILDLRADHRTGVGEVRSLELADGTEVMLDSDSAISVDFDKDRRFVHLLAGRAWFRVKHEGRPFAVEAMRGVTRDIGTAFEVAREDDLVEVGVTEGRVAVRAPDGTEGSPMRVGERVGYAASGLVALPSRPASRLAAWRSGELLFEQEPVDAAIREVARYRHGFVWTIGDFGKVAPISGLFLIERPDEALETLARMRGLRVIRLPGGHLIVRPASSG
jgi:transmembrane sensor